MKKLLFTAAFALLYSSLSFAQNVQVHYDFGSQLYSDEQHDRQDVTITLEQFKADKSGSWYYFADFDLGKGGVMSAYTEISREFKLGEDSPLAAHLEFDGGLKVGKDNIYGSRFQPATLIGAAYNGHSQDWSKTWSVQALYKQFYKAADGHRAYASAQLTGVWGLNFCDNKMTCSGFIDFWRGEKANNHGQLVILTEPQLWYNINKNISVGTEVEISNNFIFPDCQTDKTFYVNPTLAIKFNL